MQPAIQTGVTAGQRDTLQLAQEPLPHTPSMAHEASALAWLLRIEETEALLRTRQTELEHRISVSQALRQELEQNEELKASLEEQLLAGEAEHAQLKLDIARARRKLQEQQHGGGSSAEVLRLRARLRALQGRRRELEPLCSKERCHMGQFGALMQEHLQGLSSGTAELEQQLAQVEARLAAQQPQQGEQQALEASLAELQQEAEGQRQQRASLQTSLQAALESNSSLSSRLELERREQEQQVVELQQQLLKAKARTLALRRQQASKDGRLRSLQQEAQRLQGVGGQLDAALHHARDHLNMIAAQYAMDDDW